MAQKSNMIWGSPILIGDNTVPGIGYTPEQEKMIPEIIQACLDFGIDPYPPIIEMLTYDEISEVAAYGGFPVRYPHWSFGMEYERLSRQYEYGMGVIYEMIANNNPALMYCLASNTFTDHVTVIAHALFHSDFFKNNMWFEPTTKNALNEFADHGVRIQRYIDNHGQEKVIQFIDWCLSIDDLVDYAAAWDKRKMETKQIIDEKKIYKPRRLKVYEESEYMDEWVNDDSWKQYEKDRIKEKEIKDDLNILIKPDKDIMKYLLDHTPHLAPWQLDILAIMYREALYFAPQRMTKVGNEGFACLSPGSLINTDKGFLRIEEIVENQLKVNIHDSKEKQEVFNWFKHENVDVVEILTRKGYKLSGSSTHRIWDNKDEWVKLGDLKIGDNVRLSGYMELWPQEEYKLNYKPKIRKNMMQICEEYGITDYAFKTVKNGGKLSPLTKNYELAEAAVAEYDALALVDGYTQHCRRKPINVPETINEDFATFLGYMTGDGHISDVKRVVGFTTGNDEKADNYKYLVKKLFGLECRKTWDDRSKNGRWRVETHSENLRDLLVHLGYPTGVCARIKQIPDCVLQSPKNVMSAYLRAYFDCDDGAYAQPGVVLVTFSEKLGEQVQNVLMNYGIYSIRRRGYGKNADGWRITITGVSAVVFEFQIGFGIDYKIKALKNYCVNHKWFMQEPREDEIVEIKYKKGDVYDFSVANTQRYAAHGFVNHNSYGDHQMMARLGWAKGEGIVHYAKHKCGVLGGKYSMNPYALGFKILLNIEERWNKGRFGREWDLCDDAEKRKNWDKKLGLGKEKIFEVRKYENDLTLIQQYVDQEFIDKYEMYQWKAYPAADGGIEYKIESRDAKAIKRLLMEQFVNGGRPDIRLADPNYGNRKTFLMQHEWDGRTLEPSYAKKTLKPLWHIWNNSGNASRNAVAIATRNKDGDEIVYVCVGSKEEHDLKFTRKQFEAEFA